MVVRGMTRSTGRTGFSARRGLLIALVTLAGCTRSCGHDDAASLSRGPFPPQCLARTEVRPLPRSADGRTYQLHIALPASFDDDPDQHFPVLYLCDGYWDLALVKAIADNLTIDRAVPEMIIVGLGYAGEHPNYARMRRWDLTPAPATYDGNALDGPSGHAKEFLAAIETEIVPLVEREYRGDPGYRVLAGSSQGGLFTLYAMLARPGLFYAYVAASPVVEWADDWLLGFEAEFHKSGQPLGGRLFMSAAEDEFPEILEGVKRFDARMRERQLASLRYEFRIIEGERHAGTKAESFNRGLRFAFSPRAALPSDP
jgi:predicted alpha/beta superfamily hydrolase